MRKKIKKKKYLAIVKCPIFEKKYWIINLTYEKGAYETKEKKISNYKWKFSNSWGFLLVSFKLQNANKRAEKGIEEI